MVDKRSRQRGRRSTTGMGELRHREVKQFAHISEKSEGWDLNPGSLSPKSILNLSTMLLNYDFILSVPKQNT